MAAANPSARWVHLELAAEYARRAGASCELDAEQTPDEDQRIA